MKSLRLLLPLGLMLFGAVLLRAEPVKPFPAPAWTLKDVNGADVSLSQFKGKVVVLDFWATWCPPCRSEIPGYVRLYKKYAKDGLAIVGVSLDQQGPSVVQSFITQFGVNYPIVMGDDAIQAAFGGIDAIPTTFIINRDGMVVDHKVGAMETSEYEKVLLQYLKPAAAKS